MIQSFKDRETMKAKKLDPVHPGEVLREEFLLPMGLSQNRVAIDIGVPARRINEIVLEKRRITADTALRLGKFFGNTPQFWLGLQADYDLELAEDLLHGRIDREVRPYAKGKARRLLALEGRVELANTVEDLIKRRRKDVPAR